MADIVATVSEPSQIGKTLTDIIDSTDPANDSYFLPNDGRIALLAVNKHASNTLIVTVVTPATVEGLAVADRAVDISPAEDMKLIGPFRPSVYNNPANGRLKIDLTVVTDAADLELYAIRLP